VSTSLRNRDGGRRLFDMLRRGDVLVVRWVDRLGRNYQDVTDAIREFMRRGVIVKTVINGLTFDGATTDAMQQAVRDALIAFMRPPPSSSRGHERAQRAGIDHAKETEPTKFKGRKPEFTRAQFDAARALLSTEAAGMSKIAKETGLKRQTVYRIKDDPAAADAALSAWGM